MDSSTVADRTDGMTRPPTEMLSRLSEPFATVMWMNPDPLERRSIRRDALGIAAYAAAFGASFGAVSVASGLTVAQTIVLSVLMFTGASQFSLVGVIGGGGAALTAVPAALLLRVRNAFYGISLSQVLGVRGRLAAVPARSAIHEAVRMPPPR